MEPRNHSDDARAVWAPWAGTVYEAARQAVERARVEEPELVTAIEGADDASYEVAIDVSARRLAVYLRLDDAQVVTVGHIVLDARDPDRLGAWESGAVMSQPVDYGDPH